MSSQTGRGSSHGDAESGESAADKQLFDQVFSAVYEELRRLASTLKRDDRSATLATTDVVDEAYLRLYGSPELALKDRLHFKRIAGRAMRQILVDAARRKLAGKRGGLQTVAVTLGEAWDARVPSDTQVLDLHAAIKQLGTLEPRQGNILEMKYFGGFHVGEIAEYLELSERTVARDLRVAEAWLKLRLSKTSES